MVETNLVTLKAEYEEFARQFDRSLSCNIVVDGKITSDTIWAKAVVDDACVEETFTHTAKDELEQKRYLKRYTKLVLYKALSKKFNKELPWGAINGIRPVKFARQLGGDYKRYLTEQMLVSGEKAELLERIILTQDKMGLDSSKIDLFIGIPFCPSRCAYCSFISEQITKKTRLNEYIDCLCKEIEAGKDYFLSNLGSIYIGGGTPIALPVELLEKLLKTIGKHSVEYTVEAGRPDCFDKDKLKLFADYGVNRICVNPQTFNDKTLVLMGRKHTTEQTINAFKLAREFDFIVNTDLIAGLVGESVEDFKFSMDKALELNAENITVHTLCLKAGSKLKTQGQVLSEDGVNEMHSYSQKLLYASGYNPYYLYRQKYSAGNLENVGYAKSGTECRYNIAVMEEITDNHAFGAGANTKVIFGGENRIERYFPPKDINTYIQKIDKIIEEKDKLLQKKLQLN